jgi:release factor glutamine methyltransferase
MPEPVKSNAPPHTVSNVKTLLRGNDLPHLERTILLAHALGMTRTMLLANPDYEVTPAIAAQFRQLADRRVRGEPTAYLTGTREFYSLELDVTPGVLIPRPETELLVDAALGSLDPSRSTAVLELGTGSGAIAIALARHRPRASIVATDVSAAALEVARSNAAKLGASNIEFVHSDWYASVPGDRFDLIVSNPPYVAESDPHLAAGDLRFEPRSALTAGPDGLSAIRRIVAGGAAKLAQGGRLMFEHGYDQGEAARTLMAAAGFAAVTTLADLAGHERVCTGVTAGDSASLR